MTAVSKYQMTPALCTHVLSKHLDYHNYGIVCIYAYASSFEHYVKIDGFGGISGQSDRMKNNSK